MKTFSVIIPTFNRAGYIRATLDSVFAQRYQDFEVIVADDGSTDDTLKVIEMYGKRIQVLTQANKGEGGARNLGVQAAMGRYIAFIDSDDLWFPWTLETFAQSIEKHNEPAIIMGADVTFEQEEEIKKVHEGPVETEYFTDYFSASPRLFWRGVNGNVFKRSAMAEIGLFNETRMVGLDIDYLFRMGCHGGFVKIAAPVTFGYRWHASNITQNTALMHRGIRFLVDQERMERYPGGKKRQWERRRLIAFHARAVSVRAVQSGHPKLGWDLYRRTASWNLRLGKMKYLLGFPAITVGHRLKGKRCM